MRERPACGAGVPSALPRLPPRSGARAAAGTLLFTKLPLPRSSWCMVTMGARVVGAIVLVSGAASYAAECTRKRLRACNCNLRGVHSQTVRHAHSRVVCSGSWGHWCGQWGARKGTVGKSSQPARARGRGWERGEGAVDAIDNQSMCKCWRRALHTDVTSGGATTTWRGVNR
eukprot:gene6269-biopygen17854